MLASISKGALITSLLLLGKPAARMAGEPVLVAAVVDNIDEGIVTLDVPEYPTITLPEEALRGDVREGSKVYIRAVALDSALSITVILR